MKFSRINHCCIDLRTSSSRVITDPFFIFNPEAMISPKVAYQIAEGNFLKKVYDAIFISHCHIDHFSADSLKLFSHETPIYIPFDQKLYSMIKELGFKNINMLKNLESTFINDLKITLTPSEAMVTECGFLFESKDESLWHCVDSILSNSLCAYLKPFLPKEFTGLFTYKTMSELIQREAILEKDHRLDKNYYEQSLTPAIFFNDQHWIPLDQGWFSHHNPNYSKHFSPKKQSDVCNELKKYGVFTFNLPSGSDFDLTTKTISPSRSLEHLGSQIDLTRLSSFDREVVINWDLESSFNKQKKSNISTSLERKLKLS